VSDEQQTPVGGDGSERLKGLTPIEAAGQRWVCSQPLSLLLAPLLGGQLGGLTGTRLGAEQHDIEVGFKERQGDARSACLRFAPHGQPALGVSARAMRLCLGVT
jgi:hypothetical protein